MITMTDDRNRLCQEVESQSREVFADGVFQTTIPRNVRLGEAPSHGRSIVEYSPTSLGAQAYHELADELVARWSAPAAEVG